MQSGCVQQCPSLRLHVCNNLRQKFGRDVWVAKIACCPQGVDWQQFNLQRLKLLDLLFQYDAELPAALQQAAAENVADGHAAKLTDFMRNLVYSVAGR